MTATAFRRCHEDMALSKSRLRASLGALLAYALIFDYGVYVLCTSYHWPHIFRKPDQVRLLLVADSRLPFSPGLSEAAWAWDEERFVRRTFRAAVDYVQPHAVAFLGDLFAQPPFLPNNDSALLRERFGEVFALDAPIVAVVVPGERDVGTDADDPGTAILARAFRRELGSAEPRKLPGGLELFPVDSLVYEQLPPDAVDARTNSVRVMLSHLPVIPLLDVRLNLTVAAASPDVIFSAHELSSALIRTTRHNPTDFASMVNAEQGQLERFLVSREDYLELVVPSCSSRATYQPGYGVALFTLPGQGGGEPTFDYAVLWTPMRALHLWGYAVVSAYAAFILVLPLGQVARLRWAWRKNFLR